MSVTSVTKENFDELLANNPLVVIDFWAEWCAPCKAFSPVFETVAERNPNILFGSVNVEEQPELAAEFEIRSIPFLMILKDRNLIYADAGSLSAAEFNDLIEEAKSVSL